MEMECVSCVMPYCKAQQKNPARCQPNKETLLDASLMLSADIAEQVGASCPVHLFIYLASHIQLSVNNIFTMYH